MNKDIFKSAFENVKPSEELVNSVLEFQNALAVPEKTKGQSFFAKPRKAGIIAACAVFVIGMTAAAAEFIDFNAVFGKYITVEDTELANSLIGTVSRFKYKVSDKDYKIAIKGAMGTGGEIIAFAEISRKDGTPVVDHFVNPVDDDVIEQGLDNLWSSINIENYDSFSGGYGSYINENGNIEICTQFEGERNSKDKKIIVKGENFYPRDDYWEFCKQQGVYYMDREDIFKGYVQEGSKYDNVIPADVDDSSVLLLDLEWEFSFVFKASEKSNEIKSQEAPEENFVFRQEISMNKLQEDGRRVSAGEAFIYERTAVPSYIEGSSTGGRIDFVYEANEYDDFSYDSNYSWVQLNNELYIILKDGSRMNAEFDSGINKPDGDIMKCSYKISYLDKNGDKTYVDVDNITAISINGTVYELN